MKLLEKLFLGGKEEAYDEIVSLYEKQGWCVVSFLYFANVMKGRLLEEQQHTWQKEYKEALIDADILFADGIALQLFYRWGSVGRKKRVMPPNLNGTDFNPYFLDRIFSSTQSVHIGLYTLYDEKIGKPKSQLAVACKAFEERFGHAIDFAFQTDYALRSTEPFDFAGYANSLSGNKRQVNILLLSIGTPAQELWAMRNMEFIKTNRILIINAGGTIDYISGFEKRAPARVVKARVLETPWRIMQNPKKNLGKFLVMFGILRYWYGLSIKYLKNLLQ